MTLLSDIVKCPNCHRKGTMVLTVRKKTITAQCEACDEVVSDRVPYPKHRADHEGHQYHYRVGAVRPITAHEDDEMTCTQKEWEEKHHG